MVSALQRVNRILDLLQLLLDRHARAPRVLRGLGELIVPRLKPVAVPRQNLQHRIVGHFVHGRNLQGESPAG